MASSNSLPHEQIVDRVIGVFMAKGYEGTSVKDLVDATGLHPGSLYNAFGSKQGIFEAAIDRFDEISPFNKLLAQSATAPPRQTIRRLLDGLVEPAIEGEGVAGCLITYAAAEVGSANARLSRRLDDAFQDMETNLTVLIERGQGSGEFGSKRPARELAKFLLSTVQGIQVMAKVSRNRADLQVAADVAYDALEPAG